MANGTKTDPQGLSLLAGRACTQYICKPAGFSPTQAVLVEPLESDLRDLIAEVEGLRKPTVLLFPRPSWQPLTENRGIGLEFFSFPFLVSVFSRCQFFLLLLLILPILSPALLESSISETPSNTTRTRRPQSVYADPVQNIEIHWKVG